MTEDGEGTAEGETKESGDKLAESLAPEPGEFPGQPGPQGLVHERGALPEELVEPSAPELGEPPEQAGSQTLIPERGALPE